MGQLTTPQFHPNEATTKDFGESIVAHNRYNHSIGHRVKGLRQKYNFVGLLYSKTAWYPSNSKTVFGIICLSIITYFRVLGDFLSFYTPGVCF